MFMWIVLQGRLLPAWVFEKEFIIDGKKNQTYYDICPTTPLIFLNHYFDGINTNSKWPKKKPIYLMPNIEMYELRASHFWNVDVVLCKTHECYRRVRDWYKQRGNPRHTKVFYTRHTSPDPTSHAFLNLPPNSIRPKDFNDLTFTHTAGTR
jgi:hypothetical protein